MARRSRTAEPRFKPGAVFNGKILGADGVWHPLTVEQARLVDRTKGELA